MTDSAICHTTIGALMATLLFLLYVVYLQSKRINRLEKMLDGDEEPLTPIRDPYEKV
jgi:hypothetical protein